MSPRSIWCRFGVDLGSGRPLLDLASILGCSEVDPVSIWCRLRVGLGSIASPIGADSGSTRVGFGIELGLIRGQSWVYLGTIWRWDRCGVDPRSIGRSGSTSAEGPKSSRYGRTRARLCGALALSRSSCCARPALPPERPGATPRRRRPTPRCGSSLPRPRRPWPRRRPRRRSPPGRGRRRRAPRAPARTHASSWWSARRRCRFWRRVGWRARPGPDRRRIDPGSASGSTPGSAQDRPQIGPGSMAGSRRLGHGSTPDRP